MCRGCFLKFFIIKFHSKPFCRNCFVMLPFLTACWWFYTLLEIVIIFWVIWFILAQFWLWYCILDIIKLWYIYILVLTTLTFFEESYKLCMLSRYSLYHSLFGIPWTCILIWALFMLDVILRCLDVCLIALVYVRLLDMPLLKQMLCAIFLY